LPGSERSRLEPAMRSYLDEQVPHVGPQGAGGDLHFTGHLRRALASDDPAQHLPFPLREQVRPVRVSTLRRPRTVLSVHDRAEDGSACDDHIERAGNLIYAPVLAEKPG